MSNGPNAWKMIEIDAMYRTGNGVWAGYHPHPLPARPIGPNWLSHRWRLAWAVWTGRADALFFPDEVDLARINPMRPATVSRRGS